MAQLLVRKIDETLKEQLRAQAKAKGRSLEEEARAVLKGNVESAIESMRRAPVDPAHDLLIRNLEYPLRESLRVRARAHGRSVEEEARAILKDAIEPSLQEAEQYGLGSKIHALFKDIGLSDEESALFDRPGRPARAADFD